MKVILIVILIAFGFSCSNKSAPMYQYEYLIWNTSYPQTIQRYISYKDMLVIFTLRRYDSTIANAYKDNSRVFTRFDTSRIIFVHMLRPKYIEVSIFGETYKTTKIGAKEDLRDAGGYTGRNYKYTCNLRDTMYDGQLCHICDTIIINERGSAKVTTFFRKIKNLNTFYDISNIGYQDKSYKLLGGVITEPNLKFYSIIQNLREADPRTREICEAIYKRLSKDNFAVFDGKESR
jgi:hypothetical protein